MANEKEYIVTVKKGVDWEEIHNELTTNTTGSETVPDRTVDTVNLKPNNNRNTHYALTDEEAVALRNDPRIQSVIDPSKRRFSISAFQDGNFNKTTTVSGEQQNWGLLRHISATNNFGTSTDDPGGTYNYVLDGTGVDVVITDSGIQPDHPEWQDAAGVSRLQQIDWYTASGVPGTQHPNHYRDYNGHGTHVAGTVAGKTFGWAKNAQIYSLKINGLEDDADGSTGIPSYDVFDVILGWHNAKAGSRPTVVNASWGLVVGLNTNVTPNQFVNFEGTPIATITGGSYRGVAHSDTTRSALISKGLSGQNIGYGYYLYDLYDAAYDADLEQLIDAGIIFSVSSGNNSQKLDVSGGLDYDNYLTLSEDIIGDGSFRLYYNRPGSPQLGSNPGLYVGALDSYAQSASLDRKAYYSNGGPAVNIYTAGTEIISAISSINNSSNTSNYYLNGSYKQAKFNGTSMAAPQMAGMAACLLQAHPTWSTSQIMNWFQNKSTTTIYSTGNNNDYTNTNSIWGSTQRVAYFPLNGQNPFQYTSS